MCPDTVETELLSEVSKIAWESTRVARITNEHERRKTSNRLAMKSAKCTLDLIRAGREDIALETGVTTIYLFHLGEHYGQVISCSEALEDRIAGTRFEVDMECYLETAVTNMKSPNVSTKNGRLNALYSLIWEKGVLGTTEAMNEMLRRFGRWISNPTANWYSRTLHLERRAYRLGGPTGYKIEMFLNQSVSLSREKNYGKVAFFEGQLVERGPNMFRRLWKRDTGHRRVFEIENGNDPRTFAILAPEPEYGGRRKESFATDEYGVLGELHPLSDMPDYGFEPILDFSMADFLANGSVRRERGGS